MKRITYTLLLSVMMGFSVPAAYAVQGGGSGGGGESSAEMSRDFRDVVPPRYGVSNPSGCCYVKDADKHPHLKKQQEYIMNRGLLKDR